MVAVDVDTTEHVVAVGTTEPVVVEEKPKKKSPPKKKAAPAEPVVAVADATNEAVTVETTVANSSKKTAAIKAAKDLVSSVHLEEDEEIVEEPIAENKVEEKEEDVKATEGFVEPLEGFVEPQAAQNLDSTPRISCGNPVLNDYHSDDSGAHEDDDEDEEAEEIQARIMNYEGKQYLIDGDNNIYDKESFDELGTFNADTQKIIFN